MERQSLLEKLHEKGFEIQFESHAAAILEHDFPVAVQDLEQALSGLSIPITEIIGSGGGETKGTQRMRKAFNDVEWHKFTFEVKKTINGVEREAISHEIDHVKGFDKYSLALEIEWNNKDDPFLRPGFGETLNRLLLGTSARTTSRTNRTSDCTGIWGTTNGTQNEVES